MAKCRAIRLRGVYQSLLLSLSPHSSGCSVCVSAGMSVRLWGRLQPAFASFLEQNHLSHSPSHLNIKIQNFSFPSISLHSFLTSNLKTHLWLQTVFVKTIYPKKIILARLRLFQHHPPPSSHHYQLLYRDFLYRTGIRLPFFPAKTVPLCTGIKRSLGVTGTNLTPVVGHSFLRKLQLFC